MVVEEKRAYVAVLRERWKFDERLVGTYRVDGDPR